MSNTQIIPTDRHGRCYYGPTTFRAACEQIDEFRDGEQEGQSVAGEVAQTVEDAGYPLIAARLRNHYGVAR